MHEAWASSFRALAYGEILDMGYGEFMVNEAFAEDLMDGGMTHVNGAPVRLTTVDWLPHLGCVQLRWSPTETLEEMAASDAVSEARS